MVANEEGKMMADFVRGDFLIRSMYTNIDVK